MKIRFVRGQLGSFDFWGAWSTIRDAGWKRGWKQIGALPHLHKDLDGDRYLLGPGVLMGYSGNLADGAWAHMFCITFKAIVGLDEHGHPIQGVEIEIPSRV